MGPKKVSFSSKADTTLPSAGILTASPPRDGLETGPPAAERRTQTGGPVVVATQPLPGTNPTTMSAQRTAPVDASVTDHGNIGNRHLHNYLASIFHSLRHMFGSEYQCDVVSKPKFVPEVLLNTYRITLAQLDLTTGTTASAASAKPSHNSDPCFIQPITKDKIDTFRREHGKELDKELKFRDIDPWDDKPPVTFPPIETWTFSDRFDSGTRLGICLQQYINFYSDDDEEEERPRRCANTAWEEDTTCSNYPASTTTCRFLPTAQTTWNHSTAIVVDMSAWPEDGKITRAELCAILHQIVRYRNPRMGNSPHRFIPATVVCISGNCIRVLHAWDDQQSRSLNIRLSPIIICDDPVDNSEYWMEMCCFIMGDPIYPSNA